MNVLLFKCLKLMGLILFQLDVAFVCKAGRLVGWVTRGTIRRFVGNREPKPIDDCISLCNIIFSKNPDNTHDSRRKKRPGEYDSFREISSVSVRGSSDGKVFHPI